MVTSGQLALRGDMTRTTECDGESRFLRTIDLTHRAPLRGIENSTKTINRRMTMNEHPRILATIVDDPTNSKWSSVLSGNGNLPADIVKFHLNLVLLDYSAEDVSLMLDSLQADYREWGNDRSPIYDNAAQVDSFFAACAENDIDSYRFEDPLAQQRHKRRQEAREIFARLSRLRRSDWSFARALSAYGHVPRRYQSESGEPGYCETTRDIATNYLHPLEDDELHCMDRDWRCSEHDPNHVAGPTAKERQEALALLRRKLVHACKPEAVLFDSPLELILYCALEADADVDACLRLTDFFYTWRRYGYAHFMDGDELESFIAYWVMKRWDAPEPAKGEPIPRNVLDDIRTIRAFCGWRAMPAISCFAQSLKCYCGDPIDEKMYLNSRTLHAYLTYAQRWFLEVYLGEHEEEASTSDILIGDDFGDSMSVALAAVICAESTKSGDRK